MLVPAAILSLVLVPLPNGGCGIPSPSNTTTTGETDDDGDDDGDGNADPDDDEDDDGGDDDGLAPCSAAVAALTPFVTRPDGGCSVVLRVHHETLALLGYHATCAEAPAPTLDEAQARALTECCTSAGTALEPAAGSGPWVLHAAPGTAPDELGGVAVVSRLVAERVLEATIGRGEDTGAIVFPESWVDDTSVLGEGCGTVAMPELVGQDLVEGGALAAERMEAVWGVAGTTALPLAMSVMSELQRVVVIRWPRRIDIDDAGAFEPSTAEYLVVLEGGATQ